MIVILLLVGFVGYYFNQQSSSNITNLYKEQLIPIKLVNENRTHLRANEANLLWIIMAPDRESRQKYISDIKVRAEKFNQNMELFKKTKLDDTEIREIESLELNLREYRQVRARVIELAVSGKSKEAFNYFIDNKASFEEAAKNLVFLGEFNQKEASNIDKQNVKDANFANVVILLALILSVSFATVFVVAMYRMFERRFTNLVNLAKTIEQGDFTADAKIEANDEIGNTAKAILSIAKNLRKLVQEINKSVEEISAGTEEMSAAADQTSQGAQQVATSITQLAAGAQEQANNVSTSLDNINNIDKEAKQIALRAGDAVNLSNTTKDDAVAGQSQAQKAVHKVNQLKSSSIEISKTINELGKLGSEIEVIVDLIKTIANQTNLLALNAAIEAARAGEHGKGFAVVADEVKKLASQSAEATDKITGMIKEIQTKTNNAVVSMNENVKEVDDGVVIIENVGQSLGNILNAATQTSLHIQEISKEAGSLARNSDIVVRMMENISSITEESAAGAEEIASITEEQTASVEEISASSQTLAKIAETLYKQVAVFKV